MYWAIRGVRQQKNRSITWSGSGPSSCRSRHKSAWLLASRHRQIHHWLPLLRQSCAKADGKTLGAQKYGLELNRYQYDAIDLYCQQVRIPWFASCWDLESLVFMREYDLFMRQQVRGIAQEFHESFLIDPRSMNPFQAPFTVEHEAAFKAGRARAVTKEAAILVDVEHDVLGRESEQCCRLLVLPIDSPLRSSGAKVALYKRVINKTLDADHSLLL